MIETRPAVFVAGNDYHIMIPVTCPCLMWVKVGGMCYYDESCRIMKSDVRVHRMIVPKELLDKERKYVICARKIIQRKPYYTEYLAEGVKNKVIICHNPFTRKMSPPFDIEEKIYGEWAKLLREDIKPDVMICGHTHKLEIDEVGGKNDFYGQACPIIIGSEPEFYDPKVSDVKSFKGCGIEFSDKEIKAVFTSCSGEVIGEYFVKVG